MHQLIIVNTIINRVYDNTGFDGRHQQKGAKIMKENEKIMATDLENISGGMVVYAQGLPEFDPVCPWEVVENNNCRLLGKFTNRDDAIKYAKSFGPESYNAQETDIATVNRLRQNPQGNG